MLLLKRLLLFSKKRLCVIIEFLEDLLLMGALRTKESL
jgi:hypothetical protein